MAVEVPSRRRSPRPRPRGAPRAPGPARRPGRPAAVVCGGWASAYWSPAGRGSSAHTWSICWSPKGTRSASSTASIPPPTRRRPDYLNPAAELIEGDLTDPAVAAAAVEGIDAVSHQAAMVGLGLDFADVGDYVAANDLGTARLLAALARADFRGPLVLASSMVVYGEGRYRCPTHGDVRPAPREPADLEAGRFEPPCPLCGLPLEPASIDEDAPTEPRSVYAATKLHQEHLCGALRPREPGGQRDDAPLPQRLRAADAARHPLRGRRQHLPQRARRGPGAARLRGRRPAARLHPRRRHRPRQPRRARPARRPGRLQRRHRQRRARSSTSPSCSARRPGRRRRAPR